ncbi:protein LNK2-like isoform X2 [Lolium rigidum]|uniref:protein LNK2-like isoform X2 n=1 Tax=Lolium rigidum TaxID=89674 RepID=UPI001F5DD4CC|nr:protein LNK2-like isoform X2 [Lolium rigidum]
MLDWNDEDRQQAGDKIWAELNGNEDPAPPNDTKNDGTLVFAGYQKKNDNEAATVPVLTEPTSDGPTEHPALQKQPTPLDMESWPDLPSLTTTLDRNDYIASTYLDFSSAPAVQKVAGISSVFGSEHDEKSNSFLDCNWGNIGDFDDFDRLFSNSEALFRDEVVVNGSNFLSTSSAVVNGTAQSIPSLRASFSKQPSSDSGSSSLLINDTLNGVAKQENEGDVQKRPTKSRRKPEERSKSKTSNTTSGFSQEHTIDSLHSLSKPPAQHVQTLQYTLLHDSKYMERFQHANQFKFPGYGYPAWPFPSIPLVSNIQAEGHQANPVAASCRTSVDSPKQSSSTEKPLMMTPQEKIEKLRRRQQRQALIAIQQQKQQFGQEGSGSSTLVAQAYSPRKKNPDYSSGIIDENAPQQTSAGHEEIQRESGIPDDPFLEEKIYYELKDALGKLDTSTRLSIRDSLLRLANSSSQRQIAGYRTISDNSKRGEDDITENGASNKRKRSPLKEAETDTNPIDRIVAHLLFHRPCSKFATSAKEETLLLTPVSLEADPKMPRNTPLVPSAGQ